MNEKHRNKIILKLNRETKEDIIKWEKNRTKPSSLAGSEILVENVYTTKVLERHLRLYRFQAKYFYDEESFEWTDSYRLEFIDIWGNCNGYF